MLDYFVIFCLFQCGVTSTWNTYMQTQPQTLRVNHHNRRRERKKINMENGSDQMWNVWRVFRSIPDEISPSLAQRLSSFSFSGESSHRRDAEHKQSEPKMEIKHFFAIENTLHAFALTHSSCGGANCTVNVQARLTCVRQPMLMFYEWRRNVWKLFL